MKRTGWLELQKRFMRTPNAHILLYRSMIRTIFKSSCIISAEALKIAIEGILSQTYAILEVNVSLFSSCFISSLLLQTNQNCLIKLRRKMYVLITSTINKVLGVLMLMNKSIVCEIPYGNPKMLPVKLK